MVCGPLIKVALLLRARRYPPLIHGQPHAPGTSGPESTPVTPQRSLQLLDGLRNVLFVHFASSQTSVDIVRGLLPQDVVAVNRLARSFTLFVVTIFEVGRFEAAELVVGTSEPQAAPVIARGDVDAAFRADPSWLAQATSAWCLGMVLHERLPSKRIPPPVLKHFHFEFIELAPTTLLNGFCGVSKPSLIVPAVPQIVLQVAKASAEVEIVDQRADAVSGLCVCCFGEFDVLWEQFRQDLLHLVRKIAVVARVREELLSQSTA